MATTPTAEQAEATETVLPFPGSIPAPPPGIYEDIPEDEYRRWDAINASFLKDMARAPAFAKDRRDRQFADDEQPDPHWAVFGRLFHLLLTEPEKAGAEYAVTPETYPSEKSSGRGDDKVIETVDKPWNMNATYCKEWVADQKGVGKTCVKAKGSATKPEMAEAVAMAETLRNDPDVGPLLKAGRSEVSWVFRHEPTGLLLKGRWDVWSPAKGVAADGKSTNNAEAPAFLPEIRKRGYGIQIVLYIRAMQSPMYATELAFRGYPPLEYPWFMLIAIEKHGKYLHVAYDIQVHADAGDAAIFLEHYGKLLDTALAQTRFCIDNDAWPGYHPPRVDVALDHKAYQDFIESHRHEG